MPVDRTDREEKRREKMTKSLKDLPNEVQGVASINRRGNVVDDGWYRHITHADSGNAHLLAIMILADICYWYTPTITTDERTDAKDYKKKFAADKLQKSYRSLAEKFGVSKRMAQTACYRLKELDLITIEVRDIDDRQGITFMEPISENIKKISCMCLEFQDTPLTFKSDPPSLLKVTPPTFKSEHTYTTPETTLQISEEEDDKKKFEDEKKNVEESPENHQGENKGETQIAKYRYLAQRVEATDQDLVEALKAMDNEPNLDTPVAWLITAIKNAKSNRELGSRPKIENKLASKRTAPRSTRAKADMPITTTKDKYDKFYL
jgi:hypothetical protein